MTYCAALTLQDGMIFASDTRTNAGIDYVASVRKMTVFSRAQERVICIVNAGNLAHTQGVINLLESASKDPDNPRTLLNVSSMYDAALLVGEAVRVMQARDGEALKRQNIDCSGSFLIGGQIRGEKQRLFHVYPQGNFIEATVDTPFLQIGESKYGKPILDRVIKHTTALADAAKCVMISFDSTIRSNLSVGLPIDVLIYHRDQFTIGAQHRITEDDPYYQEIHRYWGEGIREVFSKLPHPPMVKPNQANE